MFDKIGSLSIVGINWPVLKEDSNDPMLWDVS